MPAIFKKEIHAYFTTFTGYIFLCFYILSMGYYFRSMNIIGKSPYFSSTLSSTFLVLMILIPTLTMRLFSEEIRQKTDQLIFTAPISVKEIVIGKFLAASALFAIGFLVVCTFPFILSNYCEIPWSQTIGALIGYFLMACAFISVGLFVSVCTSDQISAALISFAAMFFIYMIDNIIVLVPAISKPAVSLFFVVIVIMILSVILFSGTKNIAVALGFDFIALAVAIILFFTNGNIYDGVVIKVLGWFSVLTRFNNLCKGIFSFADVIYFITFIAAFLFLTVNVIEKRRWS